MSDVRIKVRPFSRDIEQPGRAPVRIAGVVSGQTLIVMVLGREIPLRTIDSGSDERGPYATVEEQEHELAGRIHLRIEPEYEEDADPGGQISVVLPPHPAVVKEIAAALALNTEDVHVLLPIQRGFSVYFDAEGRMNGMGWSGAAEQR